MSGERFDSGGVLSRARPVLTFATVVGGEASPSFVSPRTSTPVPVPMSWSGPQLPRRNDLPVIPRIVRRTTLEQLFGPIVDAAFTVRRAGGMLLFAALGLVTLGTIAGLGVRSLPDEPSAPAVCGAAHAFDATATERLLARAPLTLRIDRPATLPSPAPLPQAARAPVRASPAPARTAFATVHAAKKHTSTTVLAHR
jgi:hypothetical protein